MFSSDDIATILDATGEDIAVTLSGVTVGTIRAKFRSDYEVVSPFEVGIGTYSPAFLCDPASLVGLTDEGYVYVARTTEYVQSGPVQSLSNGFARVILEKA